MNDALAASGGGTLSIKVPGTWWFNASPTNASTALELSAGVNLELGAGVEIKLAPLQNCNFIRNKNWGAADGSAWIGITSIVTADGNVVTVTTTAPHGLSTGADVLINGALQDEYNDVVTITVTGASTFTFLLNKITTGSYTSPATFQSASFTGTTTAASKVVTSVSSLTGVYPGMQISGTGIPSDALIDTIDSATQITLTKAATGTNAGLTAKFALRCTRADRRIKITGPGKINHNLTQQTTSDNYLIYAVAMRNLADSTFSGYTCTDSASACNIEGSYRNLVERIHIEGATTYQSNGMHPCDHSGRDVTISNITGSTKDDFLSIIQKQYTQYTDAGSPIGPITRIRARGINPSACLAAVKFLPSPGLVSDDVVIEVKGRVSSTNYIAAPCYDPVNTGVYTTAAIGRMGSLTIEDSSMISNPASTMVNATAHASQIVLNNTLTGTLNASGHLVVIAAGAVVDRIRGTNVHVEGSSSTLPIQVIGSCLDIAFAQLTAKGVSSFIKLESTSPNGARIRATNVTLDACGSFLTAAGPTNIVGFFTNCAHLNYTSNWLQAPSASAISAFFSNCPLPSANTFGGTWNNSYAVWDGVGVDSMTSAATVTPNGLLPPRKTVTVNQNMTIANPTSIAGSIAPPGHAVTIVLVEDATGNHTVSWGTNWIFSSAFVQSGAGSANKRSVLRFEHDGNSKMVQVGSTNVWN